MNSSVFLYFIFCSAMDHMCNNVCLFEICVYIDIFACNKISLFTPCFFHHIS